MRANELVSRRPPQPQIMASSDPVQSAAANLNYEPISLDMLREISQEHIQNFFDYLSTIPFRYNDSAPSVLGRHLMTEADVRMFFDSSILLVVWPVALAMVPTVRNADLVLANRPHPSRPDTCIVAYNGSRHPPTVAQIECKGPQGLDGFKNVFRAYFQGRAIQTPNCWNHVTRQLRKYVKTTTCRAILCSDASDAYIFVFPPDESSSQVVQFVLASDDASNVNASLTLREAVLYLVYLGIGLESTFSCRYVSNMPGLLLSDLLFNLTAVLTTNREYPVRRHNHSVPTEGDYKAVFGPIPPEPAEPSHVQPSRQSTQRLRLGDVVRASSSFDHIARLKKDDKPLEMYTQLLVKIDEVVTEDVFGGIPLNSPDTGRIMLKFFPVDSLRMMSEINAYQALQSLQGSVVPDFISVFAFDSFRGYALGLSAVDGMTLRQYFETEAPTIELFRLVWSQLRALHDCGVAHMDVRAENILIKHDGSVVFIDFSISL